MFASSRRDGGLVRCVSKDGLAWSPPRLVFAPHSGSRSWNSLVNRACVIERSGFWLMWFTGQDGCKSKIGVAKSTDGVHFEQVLSDAVLEAEHSYEGISVMNPCVLWDDARKVYRMWYAAGDDFEPDVICYAESSDGISWDKYTDGPVLSCGSSKSYDSAKVGGCDVVVVDESLLVMFYIGYQNVDVARVCVAVSNDDGLSWVRSKANPILSPRKGKWDSDAVYKPSAIIDATGVVRLWFNARRNHDEYIGMAYVFDIESLLEVGA